LWETKAVRIYSLSIAGEQNEKFAFIAFDYSSEHAEPNKPGIFAPCMGKNSKI
jgi:hypothetical protein